MRIKVHESAGRAVLYGHVTVPSRFSAQESLGRIEVTLDVTVGSDGIPIVEAVTVRRTNGREVSTSDLRRVAVARLVDEALSAAGRFTTTDEGWLSMRTGDPSAEETAEAVRTVRGYRQRTPETLQAVAQVYRDAFEAGSNPTEAVRRHLGGAAPRTAREWVTAARQQGYLPATTRGRARAYEDRQPGQAKQDTKGDRR